MPRAELADSGAVPDMPSLLPVNPPVGTGMISVDQTVTTREACPVDVSAPEVKTCVTVTVDKEPSPEPMRELLAVAVIDGPSTVISPEQSAHSSEVEESVSGVGPVPNETVSQEVNEEIENEELIGAVPGPEAEQME